MKQIQLLQEELRNEKEKARKKEEEDFRASMKEIVYSLSELHPISVLPHVFPAAFSFPQSVSVMVPGLSV